MPITRNGVDITNILQSGSVTLNDFSGFGSYSTTNLAWDKQNSIGITRNGTDVGPQFMAKYVDYTSSQNGVTIPDGVTRLKIICIGGGGGSGGGSSNYNNGGQPGHAGGGGAAGAVLIANIPRTNNTYNVVVGAGGNRANDTEADYSRGNVKAVGQTSGGPTSVNYNGTYTATGGLCGYSATGGNGGAGANMTGTVTSGGFIDFNMLGNGGNYGCSNCYDNGGDPGNTNQLDTTYPFIGGYGNGARGGQAGNGNGINENSRGWNGIQGFCRVYYLY